MCACMCVNVCANKSYECCKRIHCSALWRLSKIEETITYARYRTKKIGKIISITMVAEMSAYFQTYISNFKISGYRRLKRQSFGDESKILEATATTNNLFLSRSNGLYVTVDDSLEQKSNNELWYLFAKQNLTLDNICLDAISSALKSTK